MTKMEYTIGHLANVYVTDTINDKKMDYILTQLSEEQLKEFLELVNERSAKRS